MSYCHFGDDSDVHAWQCFYTGGYQIRVSARIRHPRSGASINVTDPGAAADVLDGLRKDGFQVPQAAIDSLRAESLALSEECPQ